jgi:hypothetical protein
MNHIKEITYRTLSNGMRNGIVSFEVCFNGQDPTAEAISSTAEVLSLIVNHPGAKCGKAHLCGPYPLHGSELVLTLIAGLKQAGFEVWATLDGQYYYQWVAALNGLSIHLEKPAWTAFPFNELIYDLADPNAPEPSMSANYNTASPLYINAIGDLASTRKSEIFAFIHRAKYKWNINAIAKPLKEYLYGGK